MASRPEAKSSFGESLRHFARVAVLVRPYWGALAKSTTISLVVGMLGLLPPYLSKLLVDQVYASHDVSLMHVLIAASCALLLVSALLGGLRAYFTAHTTLRLTNAIALLFFNHLQHLRVRFFDEHQVGEVTSRFQDVRTALNTTARILDTLLLTGVYLLLVPVFLFLLHWKLALVTLVCLMLPVGVLFASGGVLRRNQQRGAAALAALAGAQVEALSHIRTVKGMGLEHFMYERAERQTRETVNVQLRGSGYAQISTVTHNALRALGMAAFTLYAWNLILAGQLTLGAYLAYTAYIAFLTGSLVQLPGLFVEFQQAAVSLGRMFEYLDHEPEQDPSLVYAPPEAIRHPVHGELRMEGVTFGYSGDRPVLRGVDLVIPRGSVCAIVGPSGTGKSTLLRLAMRMEQPWAGRIWMDGQPLADLPLPDLRRQVTVVWQEVTMLRGTLWENLTLGAADPSRARVDEAVRICRLDALLAELPQGYHTPLAEWGATISGGQRQRLALARALVRDTPVMLLDEATSNLDMETESEVLHDFFAHCRGRTLVFVTHRVSTAALADQICVMDGGRVAAVGTHATLLDECDVYRRLCGATPRPSQQQQRRPVAHVS